MKTAISMMAVTGVLSLWALPASGDSTPATPRHVAKAHLEERAVLIARELRPGRKLGAARFEFRRDLREVRELLRRLDAAEEVASSAPTD